LAKAGNARGLAHQALQDLVQVQREQHDSKAAGFCAPQRLVDEASRLDVQSAQKMSYESGRGGLAMGARDRDDPLAARELTPRVLALPHEDPSVERGTHLGIRFTVCARSQHHVGALGVRGVERAVHGRAVTRESFGELPAPGVRAADLVAAREEDARDRGHPHSADADDVDAH